ncbi:MAG: LytR C-terminal domain-containing protein [Elusimicrobia bacterium]|nr:LytR C-terminal domain-containing protein [Elusimicrobiota bacterium]
MDQAEDARKKQIIILALGGALTLALAAAHFYSSVSRRLSAAENIEIALLSPERPMLFVYHPDSGTVNAVQLPKKSARGAGSAVQRAHGALSLFLKNRSDIQDAAFYIEVGAPDLDRVSVMLNGWRNKPGYFLGMAAYIRDLKRTEATNLSWHDLLLISLELSRLNSADFIITDLPKDFFDKTRVTEETASPRNKVPGSAPEPAAVRLEVLNASGRKGLAEQVTRYLREKGFDVIYFGNYGAAAKQTKIVNCSGNIAAARLARKALGLKDLEIYSKIEKPAVVQARIILGADFNETGIESPALFNKERGR